MNENREERLEGTNEESMKKWRKEGEKEMKGK